MSAISEALEHEASARFAATLGARHVTVAVILAAGAWSRVPERSFAANEGIHSYGRMDRGFMLGPESQREWCRVVDQEPKPAKHRRKGGK